MNNYPAMGELQASTYTIHYCTLQGVSNALFASQFQPPLIMESKQPTLFPQLHDDPVIYGSVAAPLPRYFRFGVMNGLPEAPDFWHGGVDVLVF